MNRMLRHERVNPWNILNVSPIRSYRILQWLMTIRTILKGMCLIGSYFFRSFPGNPLMSLFPATRPFSLFACGLVLRRYHAGRGSRTRFIAGPVIFLCFLGQYQDGLNRILSVHLQNGYGFIPGHEQETS